MRFIKNYDLFIEARIEDIFIDKNLGLSYYSNDFNMSDEFLSYKTISKRINNKKVRVNIEWNHNLIKHNLIDRIDQRSSLKNNDELNKLIGKGLDELFIYNNDLITIVGKYSLWFSEYNFTIIIYISDSNVKNTKNIQIKTILPGKQGYKVVDIIELKSKI